MRGRLRDLGVGSAQAVTFHAAGLRQLRYFWPQLVGDTRWELIDSKFTLVAQAANRAKVSTTTDTVRDLAGEIEWAKASLISPETYPAAAAKFGRDAPVPAEQVAKVYAGYENSRPGPTDPLFSTSTTCCFIPRPPSRTRQPSPRSSGTAIAVSSSTSTRT